MTKNELINMLESGIFDHLNGEQIRTMFEFIDGQDQIAKIMDRQRANKIKHESSDLNEFGFPRAKAMTDLSKCGYDTKTRNQHVEPAVNDIIKKIIDND